MSCFAFALAHAPQQKHAGIRGVVQGGGGVSSFACPKFGTRAMWCRKVCVLLSVSLDDTNVLDLPGLPRK